MFTFEMQAANGVTDAQSTVLASAIYKTMPKHFADFFPDAKNFDTILDYLEQDFGNGLHALDVYLGRVQEYCYLLPCTTNLIVADGDPDNVFAVWFKAAKNNDTMVQAFDLFMQLPRHDLNPFFDAWREAEKNNRVPKGEIASALKALVIPTTEKP